MKILLINPPLPERTYPGKPMGLDYLAKVLLDNGQYVDVLDLDVVGIEKLRPILEKNGPRIVGITSLSIQNDLANKIAADVKDYDSSILVVKGGAHELFGYTTDLLLHHNCIDYAVVGEGESTFLELVNSYISRELEVERKHIQGLAYYNNGHIDYTGKVSLPSPAELNEIIPKRLFYDHTYDFDIFCYKKTAQVMTTRGCANACNFCMESKIGHTERARSISSVYSEIYELKNDGYEAIYFDDPTFTRDMDRVKKICEMFRKDFPDLVWGCNTRNDCLNEEAIAEMEHSGCVYIFTGFESAVPEVLLGLNKTHNPGHYLRNARLVYNRLRKSSIKSSVFLIFGGVRKSSSMNIIEKMPSDNLGHIDKAIYEPERFDDVKMSIDFAINELKPYYISMNILRLLPGSTFSEDERFRCIRPEGDTSIHSGYYDKDWYRSNKKVDIRTTHHIYRAFEGRGSIVPPQMTPEYCYRILEYAINSLNQFNSDKENNCQLVVDKVFEEAYMIKKNGKYILAPFGKIAENGPLS
jgi:radical SAM superfamily enzyme YgiQ (UPF0313 family)